MLTRLKKTALKYLLPSCSPFGCRFVRKKAKAVISPTCRSQNKSPLQFDTLLAANSISNHVLGDKGCISRICSTIYCSREGPWKVFRG